MKLQFRCFTHDCPAPVSGEFYHSLLRGDTFEVSPLDLQCSKSTMDATCVYLARVFDRTTTVAVVQLHNESTEKS